MARFGDGTRPPGADGRPAVPQSATGRGGALPVEAARRLLQVLGCFNASTPELGVTDIAVRLEMHKSTVHRLLVTLEQEGYVRQVAGRYSLTWRMLEVAAAIPLRDGVNETTLKHLAGLVSSTGETAHLAVLDQGAVLYVQKVSGTRQLRMPSAVGRRVPLHCTSLGKILLAGMDEREIDRLLGTRQLPAMTTHTIVDPRALRKHIREVRRQGYAVDREEIEEGLMCVAAPVVNPEGVTCAAISISGPASRLQARADNNIDAVQKAAAGLSEELGPFVSQLAAGAATA